MPKNAGYRDSQIIKSHYLARAGEVALDNILPPIRRYRCHARFSMIKANRSNVFSWSRFLMISGIDRILVVGQAFWQDGGLTGAKPGQQIRRTES
jgi:hypothetical protein